MNTPLTLSQKCDAVRPTCGNCRKPRQRGPIKYEPSEPCTWDEVRGPSARTLRKREGKQRRAQQQQGDAAMVAATASQAEWIMAGPSSANPNGGQHEMGTGDVCKSESPLASPECRAIHVSPLVSTAEGGRVASHARIHITDAQTCP
jgi:hypothetical protein